MIIINPLNCSEQEKSILIQLLHENESNLIQGNIPYLVNSQRVKIQYPILKRESKSRPGTYRYEVISYSKLGNGGNGQVHPILATLKMEGNHLSLKSHKKRVVKIYNGNLDDNIVDKILPNNKRLEDLKAKNYVKVNRQFLLVMRRLPGMPLSDILLNKKKRNQLTLHQRVTLSFLLMDRYKDIFADKNFVHQDIKPDNIMVDMNHSPMKLWYIDGDSVVPFDKANGRMGAISYQSKFQLTRDDSTKKIDVYSLGRILALIWGVDYDSYDYNFSSQRDYFTDRLKGLFSHVDGLDDDSKNSMSQMLEKMLLDKNKDRVSFDESYYLFKSISYQYFGDLSLKWCQKLDDKIANLNSRNHREISKSLQSFSNKLKQYSNALKESQNKETIKNYYDDLVKDLKELKLEASKPRNKNALIAEIMVGIIGCFGLLHLAFSAYNVYLGKGFGHRFFAATNTAKMLDGVERSLTQMEFVSTAQCN